MDEKVVFSTAILGWMLLVFTAAYAFGAYVLYRIGRKFGVGSLGLYFIPIYNSVLLFRCARISAWYLLLILVPVANLVVAVYLWGTIAKELGKDFWLFGLGTALLGIPALILAFDSSKPAADANLTVASPSIYCVSGEYAGSRLPIGSAGLIIGRSPAKSNLILSAQDISGMHARVWSDRDGQVWVQDMSSSNGTYYSAAHPGQPPEWVAVKGPIALRSGVHIRLGTNAEEFVVS